eukprot:CAMPEP_0181365088 /NCGR_PEP_ID=MMETSP1106-20121128/9837_1 /TAXON_ID=81844 /ORGANISM="Mantoniella antarctica, Strain SL-175" /LENGTH=320 /DNA_ID=CAMNT_0023480053 /DNA_START=47 /DNA_END=1005 /DNA_ORIENTATION=-
MAAAVCSSGTWAGAAACRAAPPNRVPVGILTATNRRATTSNSAASNASRPCPRRGAVVAAAVSDPEEVDVAAPTSAAGVSRALEFMVEMACGKCVSRVEAAVAQVPGVHAVVATLSTNTVRVIASTTTSNDVAAAVEAAGYQCRLIGQGNISVFGEELAKRLGTDLRTLHQSLAAVAEFKGEVYGHGAVRGVVRFVQVDEHTTLIEGSLDGLTPGPHTLAVHLYGDTTRGVASVGEVFDTDTPEGGGGGTPAAETEKAGHLGSIFADAEGHATIPSRVIDERIHVWDIIGRSLAVHDGGVAGAAGGAAAVLARSAGVGEN